MTGAHRAGVNAPALGYHAAPASARDSIQRHGLRAADPSEADWSLAGQPFGVYVAATPEDAELWAGEDADLWEVDLRGLPVTADPMGDGRAWVVRTDLPANRLRAHHLA